MKYYNYFCRRRNETGCENPCHCRYTPAPEDDGVLRKCARQPVLGAHEPPNETTSFAHVLLQVEQSSDHLSN